MLGNGFRGLPVAVPLLCLCVPRGGALADSAAAERVVAVPFVMPWRACVWLPGQVPLTFLFFLDRAQFTHSLIDTALRLT